VKAQLHDGSTVDIVIEGDGPAVLLPVNPVAIEDEKANQMLAWGAEPDLGRNLITGLATAGLRTIAADYEGHLAQHPAPSTLTADAVAADLLAIADAAGADRFAYYGYSWLALAGLQLAIRTNRLTALVMGGFPPLGGPYAPMLTVTRAAHRMAMANRGLSAEINADVEPGDWDAAEVVVNPDQTQQYVTLYTSLDGFDERVALPRLRVPRLAFAGAEDNIRYGAKWDSAYVAIGEALSAHRDDLIAQGWRVELIPDADHLSAMRSATVLGILVPFLKRSVDRPKSTVE
jgi:pimeloyl-ACP methyl ester carboxylesterase